MLADLPQSYWCLASLRIALVFVPQLGYIHPDEYFQSVEVLTGKVFEVEANLPWEFNSTFPIRSMAIPYFTIGMSLRFLKICDFFLGDYNIGIISPYLILVTPRLLICLLSFFVDFSIYKICANNNEKYKSKLIVLASSYVILIYGSRTFSNTFELILFSLLLYYVSESLVFSNILIKKREYLDYRYETSKTTVEKAKFHKLKLFLTADSLRNSFPISTITVFGFFNRPTFLGYALFPVFFWLYRGLSSKTTKPLSYHLRILILLTYSVPSIVFNVIIDSFFYGYLTWGEIGVLDIGINNFVFTPFNFLKYNINVDNLAKHGIHPRFLHALVNMPLLFNFLAVFAFWYTGQSIYYLSRGRHLLLPTVRSIKGLMMLSFLAPVSFLSIFPHQEPRFIIPILVPLVYLYADKILPDTDTVLINYSDNVAHANKNFVAILSRTIVRLWFVTNIALGLFFGFVHQGGVYPVTNFLSRDLARHPFVEYHIVTTQIYSIPESFLLQKTSDKLYVSRGTKYSLSKRVFLYEEGSVDVEFLRRKTRYVVTKIKQRGRPSKRFKLLIVSGDLGDKLGHDVGAKEIGTFFPHLSVEALPDLSYLMSVGNFITDSHMLAYFFHKLTESFTLKLYEIPLPLF